jgi:hypothetical protein
MKITFLFKPLIIFGGIAAAVVSAAAQDGVQTRSIISDDFAKQRPAKIDPGPKKPGMA